MNSSVPRSFYYYFLRIASIFKQFQTKVTLESFLAWKKRKIQEKKDLLAKEEEQKRKDYKSGKQFGFSGREMFSFNPELANENDLEDDDGVYVSYEREDDDNEQVFEYKELDLDALAAEAREVCPIEIGEKFFRFNHFFLYIHRLTAVERWQLLIVCKKLMMMKKKKKRQMKVPQLVEQAT